MSATTARRHALIDGQKAGDLIGGPQSLSALLLESANRCGEFDRQDVLKRYLNWSKTEGFDTGPIAASVFDLATDGVEIDVAVEHVHALHGGMTAGCAPVHRNVVLAAVPIIADQDLELCVRQETRLTHYHTLAADTAVAASRIARSLIAGESWAAALRNASKGLQQEIVDAVESWHTAPTDRSGYSPVVLHAALYFVGTSISFADALQRSISFSGEDNFVPVLAGALAGAHWAPADDRA